MKPIHGHSPSDANGAKLDVYISSLPSTIDFEPVIPRQRNDEINGCRNERVRAEKYWAWKMLEYGMSRTFGIGMKDVGAKRDAAGKWTGNRFFSISHGGGLIAVAVSSDKVGIDIEVSAEFKRRFSGREERLTEILDAEKGCGLERLLELWTQKEASFKAMEHQEKFIPAKIKIKPEQTLTERRLHESIECCVSVCSPIKESIIFYDCMQKEKSDGKSCCHFH